MVNRKDTEPIEKLCNKCCKHSLGCNKYVPYTVAEGELGRRPCNMKNQKNKHTEFELMMHKQNKKAKQTHANTV